LYSGDNGELAARKIEPGAVHTVNLLDRWFLDGEEAPDNWPVFSNN
jgi:hypothetical protein